MEFRLLKELWQQFVEVWQNFRSYQKGIIIVTLLFVLGGLSLIIGKGTTSYVPLFSPETMRVLDKRELKSYLDAMQIPYRESGEKGIFVPADQVENVVSGLEALGFPVKVQESKGFELFDSTTWIKGEKELQILEIRALKGQLERDISRYRNVRNATIILDIPSVRPFGEPLYKPKASVILDLVPEASLTSSEVKAITSHVSSAVRGLIPNMIAISDTTGKLYQAIDPEGKVSLLRMEQSLLEEGLKEKVDGMLAKILGSRNFYSTVQVVSAGEEQQREGQERFVFTEETREGEPLSQLSQQGLLGSAEKIFVRVLIDRNIGQYEDSRERQELLEEVEQQLKMLLEGYGKTNLLSVDFASFSKDPISINEEEIQVIEESRGVDLEFVLLVSLIALGSVCVLSLFISFGKRMRRKKLESNSKIRGTALQGNSEKDLEAMLDAIKSRCDRRPAEVADAIKSWLREEMTEEA